MASFGKPRILGRLVAMIMIIFALVLGGLFWFDYLGLIDVKAFFAPAYRLLGIGTRTGKALSAESPTLLEDERFAKQLEAVDARKEELEKIDGEIAKRDAEVTQKTQEIDEKTKTLEEREKSFNELMKQYENKNANVEQNARYLTGMPPEKAVEILKALDDQSVIDVLRKVEELAKAAGQDSVVSYWLSLMPAARSADIQRKMSLKPGSLE